MLGLVMEAHGLAVALDNALFYDTGCIEGWSAETKQHLMK